MIRSLLTATTLALVSLHSQAVAFGEAIEGHAAVSPRQMLSCRLEARADRMIRAKSVTDEIIVPVLTHDRFRGRDIVAAHTDVIDAFGANPSFSFDILEPDGEGNVPLLITFIGNYRGMTLRSNYREAGFKGRIDLNSRGFTLIHPNALGEDFPGLFITFVPSEGRASTDHRERLSIYCGRTEL